MLNGVMVTTPGLTAPELRAALEPAGHVLLLLETLRVHARAGWRTGPVSITACVQSGTFRSILLAVGPEGGGWPLDDAVGLLMECWDAGTVPMHLATRLELVAEMPEWGITKLCWLAV